MIPADSKQRLHASGGYYFLLAASVGMVRPIDVEPLNRDTLVLLETDFPTQCDMAPKCLIDDPDEWTLVDRFCFFSGGPINSDEDVYYQADFDGNPIFMLAFLSPSLTPAELYKLDTTTDESDPVLKLVAAVEEVESVYDLTDRDFDDLKLYHLGPCRALPQYILQPQAWTKVLPPHFLAAKEEAVRRASEFEAIHGILREVSTSAVNGHEYNPLQHQQQSQPLYMELQPTQTAQHHPDHHGMPYGQHFLQQGANALHIQDHQYHQHHVANAPEPQNYTNAMQYDRYPKWQQSDQQLMDPYYNQHGLYNPINEQPSQHDHHGLMHERGVYEQTVQNDQFDQIVQLQPGPYEQQNRTDYEQPNHTDHQFAVSNDVDEEASPMIYDQMVQPIQYEQRNHNDQYKVTESRDQHEKVNLHDQYDHINYDQYDQFSQLQQVYGEHNHQNAYYGQPGPKPIYDNLPHQNSLRLRQQPSPSHQSQSLQYERGSSFPSNPQNQRTMYVQNAYQHSWDGSAVSRPEPIDTQKNLQRDVEEDGAFIDHTLPIDEALATHAARSTTSSTLPQTTHGQKIQVDPPEDQPPSLQNQRHPHGKHAKNVLNSNYSAYNTEGSHQPSAYCEDEYSSSPAKSLGIGDEFRIDDSENAEYPPPEAIRNGYDCNEYQTESDPPVHDEYYENDASQLLVQTQESYICTGSDDPSVLSPVTDYAASPTSDSHFSIPVSDGEYGSMEASPVRGDEDIMNASPSGTRSSDGSKRDSGLPPHSPRSVPGSEFSQSSALRGAQELLRRNRARRLSARKQNEEQSPIYRDGEDCEDPSTPVSAANTSELESGGTWESSSEMTSVVSGSSVWTDNENNPDRSSRRALILQMAKARMKSNKSGTTPTSVNTNSVSTPRMVAGEDFSNRRHAHSDFDESEEEKKFDYREASAEINLIADLD